MITINKKIRIEDKIDSLIEDGTMILDIETTGFSRVYNRIYLVGFIGKLNKEYRFYQYLTQAPEDEEVLLRRLEEDLASYSHIISFNGEAFDFSFIEERMGKYGIDFSFRSKSSLDLYRFLRSQAYFLDLENFRLKTLEKNLGIHREDTFSGGELIELYYQYERGDRDLEQALLLHNEEDIINLPSLLEYLEIVQAANTILVGEDFFTINSIKISRNILEVQGESSLENAYFNLGQITLEIRDFSFSFRQGLESAKYSQDLGCLYIEKGDLEVKSNYEMEVPDQVYLLKLGKEVLYHNIYSYLEARLLDFLGN